MESTCIVWSYLEGVVTIVYAIIVRTYKHLRAQLDKIGEEQKKIARANTKFYTNTSYFSVLNQIATFKIAISFTSRGGSLTSDLHGFAANRMRISHNIDCTLRT